MKKIILAAILGTSLLSASAQVISKGEKFFGGTFYGGSNQSEYPSPTPTSVNTNATFAPSYSWAFRDNKTIGLQGTLGYFRSKNTDAVQTYKERNFSISPGIFLVSYKELNNRFGVDFRHLLYGTYGRTKRLNAGPDFQVLDFWGAGYQFTPEVFYRFSDRFLGNASIGNVRAGYQRSNGSDLTFVNASFLQNFTLGIQYRVGKRKVAAQ